MGWIVFILHNQEQLHIVGGNLFMYLFMYLVIYCIVKFVTDNRVFCSY